MRALGCWTLSIALLGQASVSTAADQAKIDAAIKRGIDWLTDNQRADGSWEYLGSEPRSLGLTALAALALHENNVPPTDSRMKNAMQYIRNRSMENTDTYSVSLATIVLARAGHREDRSLVRSLAAKIVAGQQTTGGWGYTVPKLSAEQEREGASRKPPGDGMGDLSVTQFAVVALWQARSHGARVDEALRLVRQRLAWSQTANGGWAYHMIPDAPDSNSMTAAGAYAWVVSSAAEIKGVKGKDADKILAKQPIKRKETAKEAKRRFLAKQGVSEDEIEKQVEKIKDPPPIDLYDAVARGAPDLKIAANKGALAVQGGKPAYPEGTEIGQIDYEYPNTLPPTIDLKVPNPLAADQVLTRAIKRLGEHVDAGLAGAALYFLWSVERSGVLLGADAFGKTHWFDVGAAALIGRQNKDGSWGVTVDDPNLEKSHYKPGPDTCFALLFLKKANLGSDVTRMIVPDNPNPFFIEGADGKQKEFVTIEQAVAGASPKDVIGVRGDGPFPVGGLVIDKPLTIKGVQGYTPVFRFRWPIDKDTNLELLPKEHPQAPAIAYIKAGPTTFEGIRFQMEAPASRAKEDLAILRCVGAGVRVVNCSFTEAASKSTTSALDLQNASQAILRNVFFVGAARSIRASVKDKTNVLLKDCIQYGPRLLEASGAGELNFWVVESTVQSDQFVNFEKFTGSVNILTECNAIRAQSLIANLGSLSRETAKWDGLHNLIDVANWVAVGDSKATAIDSLKSWNDYWGKTEIKSAAAAVPFLAEKTQLGPYKHDFSPQEWSIDDERAYTTVPVKTEIQIGANIFVVGAGQGHLQFRDSPEYANWRKITLPSERSQATAPAEKKK